MAETAFYNPPPVKEKFGERLVVMVGQSMAQAVEAEAVANGEYNSDVMRRALEQYYAPKPVITADTGTDALRLPAINSIPCGPLSEAYAEASDFVINGAVALELELLEGDYWTRADGDSMLSAGIADGVRVAIRPYLDKAPRKNEIVVVNVEMEDGSWAGTIKRYVGSDEAGRPRFEDGEKNPYPLPEDCQSVEMPARVISVLGRLA